MELKLRPLGNGSRDTASLVLASQGARGGVVC